MHLKAVPPLLLALILNAVVQTAAFCQDSPNHGLKYFKNYSHKEYNLQPQNWGVVQDARGIIYVANQGGVLEFDGVSWRSYEIPQTIVNSVAIDTIGTPFVGGKNELGFMEPDSLGTLKYVSLTDRIPNKYRDFKDVYKVYATPKSIYFDTSKTLFRWSANQIKLWEAPPKNSFFASFYCSGKLFLRQGGVGLKEMKGDSLELLPIGDVKMYMMAPYDNQNILLGIRDEGFYLYDGVKTTPFPTEADIYLKEKNLYYGIRLSSGDFALATRLGGLMIMDSQGKVKHLFDRSYGLQDQSVKYVFEDAQGNLWLALNKGLTKIEYQSPISIYDDRSGIEGLILSVTTHKGQLLCGAYTGLYFREKTDKFAPIAEISSTCWSLLSIGDSLLVATTHGIFQVNEKDGIYNNQKIDSFNSYFLLPSIKDPNRVWLGTSEGVVSLYRSSTTSLWQTQYLLHSTEEIVKYMVEDQNGNLWVGLSSPKVLKVEFPNQIVTSTPIVTTYNKIHGLPDSQIRVFKIKNLVVFATDSGLYSFNEQKKTFVPNFLLGSDFAGGEKGKPVFRMAEDATGTIWLHSDRRNLRAIPKGNSYIIDDTPFLRLPNGQANTIYPDPDGKIIWFADSDALIRFDKTIKKNYHLRFKAIIRSVLVNGKLLYDGYPLKHPVTPKIKFEDRNVRFLYAAPFFEGESETRYRCRLDGYDKEWSDWTSETQKDFTNLDAHPYTFRVQAKNVYGTVTQDAVYSFRALPPWTQTWWAYLLYALGALGLFILGVRWRSHQLVREKIKLEHIVVERTKEIEERNHEINDKNIQLQSQTLQLTEQSEKLKELDNAKSRFFANISHEFRTPLTLLIGPLDQMINGCSPTEKEKKKKYALMLRNAQRLLHLINQLLELSKLDSGKMKLQAIKADIIPFLKGFISSFQILAQQKELDLQLDIPNITEPPKETNPQEVQLYFEPRKMEDILSNLLINALKFTPKNGIIRVTLQPIQTAAPHFPDGHVKIAVSDTGPGIPSSQTGRLFERFYQFDNTYEYHQKGSGIGLALTKELVELHHGTIEADSHEGEGTSFVIRLPLGYAHLSAEEMAASLTNHSDSSPHANNSISQLEIEEDIGLNGDKTAPTPETDPAKESTQKEKDIILIVEDHADMRDYIREALEPTYHVVEAHDGQEGLEKAREIIPDLIVSDIMMPHMDGFQLCQTLKSDIQTSHIPVILLTAKASEESILQGLETGADDYITKPFNTRILCARIKNLIDIRTQLQQNMSREMTLHPVKTSLSKIDHEFLKDLHTVIKANLSDPEFNVEQLCKKLYMGNTTLYRKIQALSGENPTEFIRSCRLKRAYELLKNNYGSITEVAFEVGFSSRAYFTKCFKDKFHQLPSDYKESLT